MADVLKQKEQELKALEDRLRELEEHASRVNNTGINVKTDGVSNLDRALRMTMSDMQRLKDEIAVLNGSAQRELSEVRTAMKNIPEIKLNISNLTELKKTLDQLISYNYADLLYNIDGIDFKKLAGKGFYDGSNNLRGLNHFIYEYEADLLGIDESTMNSVIQKNRDLIQMMVTDMHRELEASIKYVMNGDKEAVSSVYSDIQSKYSYSKSNTLDLFKGEIIKAKFNEDYMQTAPLSIPGVDTHVAPKVDTTEAKAKLEETKTEVDKIDDTPIVPKVDTTEAKAKLEETKTEVDKIDDTPIVPKVDTTEAKAKIEETKTEVDKIDDTPIVTKVDTTEAKAKIEEIKNKSVKVDATPITENGLDNTGLKQMHNILSKTTDDLTAYTKVFNNANESVISNIEANGTSATDLRDKLNKLLSDAQGLSKLGNSININDQGQVDGFVAKIKELDRTLSDLSPVIIANLKEINTAFQREFKLDDGTTGYLKEQLNELRSLFNKEATWEKNLSEAQKKLEENRQAALKEEEDKSKHKQINDEYDKLKKELPDLYKTDTVKLAPDLSNFAKEFVKQVDIIEYQMGRLTELGKRRDETEKALGFVVSQKDVAPIQEAKRTQLAEYDSDARSFGYSGTSDKAYLRDFSDAAKDVESINIYIKQLDDAVGKKIKGYVELFNEAQNLLKGGQSNKALYETIGSSMTRSLYGDNVDWSKMTPSGLKELESGLGNDDFFGASSTKTAESIVKVEEASNKAVASVRNYAEELNKLVEADTVLSSKQKQDILGKDFSDKVKDYGKDIEYFKGQLQSLGNTKLTDMPATQLDPNKTEDFTALTNYKSRVNEAIASLGLLKEEQAKLFNSLSDPAAMSKMVGSGISQELFNEIKAVLESGYKVNLLDGSADKEKLDQLRAGFEQLISEFRGYNIDIIPDKEIEDLAKLNALQQAINTESRRQAETAQAQANYEKDKVRYLEQYNKIAQAQANIKALESTRNNLMTGASKDEKKAISERYATEIASNQSIVRSAEQTIAKYKAEFAKHNLEIPVTPVVKTNASLSGQFKSEFMGIKASGRNEILGGLSGQDATIAKLNQQAQALGLNVDRINTRLSAMSNTIKTAFYSGDIERARSLMSAYATEVDKLKSKVEGQSKAQDVAKERQRQAAQEAERNAKAQAKAAAEAQKAAEKEKRAYEESLNAAKQKVTQGLSAIKSFADGINNAVNKIVGIIRTGIGLVNKVISGAGRILTTLGNGAKSIVSLFGGLSNRVRSTGSNFNFFKNSATELRSKIMLLKGALSTLFNNSMVNQAKKMMSSVLSMSVIIKNDLTNNTIEWAKSMEQAFGVDAKGLIADMGEISGVLHGLGMKAQDVADGGANLVMMSRYLGMMGMAGGDTDQVMTKLTSGMKGMTQAIDDLGLSVREAEMDSYLKNLKKQGGEFANIGTSFASLNEEARVYVRYASLITQFLKNFGKFDTSGNYIFDVENFRRSLNSVTGRLGLLKSTWSGFTTTVGTGLAKIGALLAGYLIPIIKVMTAAVEKVFGWLSKLTGINFDVGLNADVNSLDYDTSGTEKATEDTEELNKELEKVEEKAKKAKGSLQGFDRVNNVTSSSSNSDSASGDDEFDYSKLATGIGKLLDPLNAEYEDFLANMDKKNKEYSDKLKKGFYNLVDNLKDKAKELTDRTDFDLGFDFPSIAKNLKNVFKNIVSLIKSWGTFFIEIGLKIADDVNIGLIITKVTELFSEVSNLATAFSNVLIPVLSELYDKYLQPIFQYIGEKAVEYLDKAIEKIKEWTNYLRDNPEEAANKLREKLENLWQVFKGEKEPEGFLENIVALFKSIKDVAVALAPIVEDLVKSFGEFVKEELLPWLIDKLEELAKWLTENKDKIIKFFKKVAGIAWDGFKTFVDLVGKLIDFVVKHPNTVIAFFAGLTAIKIGSWALSTAAGIGKLVFGLSQLGGLFKGGGLLTGLGTKLSGLMTSAGGALATAGGTIKGGLATAGGTVVGGLGSVGTALGSGATTAGGLALAGGSSILGIAAGAGGLIDGITDLVDATKANTEEEKKAKQWSGGTKIGMVGAGAATGAAIGSIIPGVGTAVGAAVGAGIGGIGAMLGGDEAGGWLQNVWNDNIKPFFTETLPNFFGSLWENISTFFTETIPQVFTSVTTTISTFFTETVPNFFGTLWENIGTFFTETVPNTLGVIADNVYLFFTETVPNFFSTLWENIGTFFIETVPTTLGVIAGNIYLFFTETIPSFFSTLWENISKFFTKTIPQVWENVTSAIGTFLTETIPKFFSGLWENISTFFTETIPQVFENITSAIGTFLTETIPNFFSGLWENISTFFTETIPQVFENIVTAVGNFITVTIPNFFSGLWSDITTFFTETIPQAFTTISNKITTLLTVTIPNKISGLWDKINNFITEKVPEAFEKIKENITKFFTETIPNKISNLLSSIETAIGNFTSSFKTTVSSKTSASTAKTVTSHAVGGSIAGGQLFIANENGQPELIGNIDGSPKTNVANNNMIIEAMTNGVFTGVYNALAEVSNQRGTVGGAGQNVNLKIDGFGLIDSSTLSELSRMLAPYLSSNSKNIADINFSI